jgi:hypothetical protein
MICKFFIPKSYILKHDILKILSEKVHKKDKNDFSVSFEIFERELKKYTKTELLNHLTVLAKNEELIRELDGDEISIYSITRLGLCSYTDKKYLKLGQSERLNITYDFGKNILVLIAILTFFLSIYQGCKNKNAIDKIESRLKALENK